ncbi:hypothetical protein, partial [Aliarcobacter butzleri]|uniref:hypothetical protein n=1 Tax=Aliarcobacter butzleri TaxID=28197 RepID=UPI003AF7908A
KSMENNISFSSLSDNINSVYNVRVSPQSLRTFASVNLGYLPKKNNNKKPVENKAEIVKKPVAEKIENKNLTVEEMKKIQSSNLQNDDESL